MQVVVPIVYIDQATAAATTLRVVHTYVEIVMLGRYVPPKAELVLVERLL